MPIDFDAARWDKIKEDSERWWAGELKRPLIQMRLTGKDPQRPAPRYPDYHRTAFYDFSIPAAEIVDVWDYRLSGMEFLGDGFPVVMPDFGPGVVAAFTGARSVVAAEERTVWFEPVGDPEIADVHLEHDPGEVWLNRIKEVSGAAIERWQGNVQVSMTDLGGNLDILSTFRPSEKLLLDLYDHPDEVKRVTWEAHEMWWRYYDDINEVLQPLNPGYTAHTSIFSEQPYYILQCDFCYMIGPEMFDEFVKPELAATCRRLENAFYHLDGPGSLTHLDSLLEIEELKGVQWVFGAGAAPAPEWPEVYRKIRDAGKLLNYLGNLDQLAALVDILGTAEGVVMFAGGDIADRNRMVEFLQRYGAA